MGHSNRAGLSMPEAIVLAGGLGTRLSSLLMDRPKAMIEVGGRPFLEIMLDRLAQSSVARVILATGHGRETIERHFGNCWGGIEIQYSVETLPLGTGGAVWKAMKSLSGEEALVLNGDTIFDVDLAALLSFHRAMAADVTLALKPMCDFDRYGTVECLDGRILAFHEKARMDRGLINGGVYVLNRELPGRYPFPESFSLERDFLEKMAGQIKIGGFIQDRYFIDIGIPEDYARARSELARMRFPHTS